uniref:Uncharacterized protein n=1 Tax=Syphacia muris TaxID=451379 RepID=A0A0N5AKG7_9BILA
MSHESPDVYVRWWHCIGDDRPDLVRLSDCDKQFRFTARNFDTNNITIIIVVIVFIVISVNANDICTSVRFRS